MEDVRTWVEVPSLRGATLRNLIIMAHFGRDLTAVFSPEAKTYINNVAATAVSELTKSNDDAGAFIDAVHQAHRDGGYGKFELDSHRRLKRAFWSTAEQASRACRYGHDVIMQVRGVPVCYSAAWFVAAAVCCMYWTVHAATSSTWHERALRLHVVHSYR
jgi:hypothetical protein